MECILQSLKNTPMHQQKALFLMKLISLINLQENKDSLS